MKMRVVSKLVSFAAVVMVVLALVGDGARVMKEEEQVDHPQNFVLGGYVNPSTPGTPGFAAGIGVGPNGYCLFPGGCVMNPIGGGVGTTP